MFNLMCGNTHFTENRIVCLQTRSRSENALADYKYRGGGGFYFTKSFVGKISILPCK